MNISDMKDRMRARKWGVFNHYLPWPGQEVPRTQAAEAWNRAVDSFDTDRLAKTLHELGAGYYFLTVMHGAEYMPVPCRSYEQLVKQPEGTVCARRDLVLDLYESLRRYDIDLCLYYNGLSPFNFSYRADCREAIFGGPVEVTQENTFRKVDPMTFVPRWAEPMRELSERYGDKIKMWWLDSCYSRSGYTEALLKYYHDALKAGNPNVLIAYNDGELYDNRAGGLVKHCSFEDYTCGECPDFLYTPDRADYDGAMTHMLIPVGKEQNGNRWGMPGTDYTPDFVQSYVRRVNAVGGIVTLDLAVKPDGGLYDEQVNLLRGMNR